jgi:LysR family hydrogen peroxide-inducible transcriptional activator
VLSTKQLRYFDAVARLGHFRKAADLCAVTQPALSMQIADMEQQLGVELIERRAKGIALTEAGKEVARRAARILAELRDISDFADHCKKPLSAPIRLGVIPTIAPYMLPPLLPLLRSHYPELTVQVRETQTDALVADLVAGALDLLVLALPIEHAELETIVLREDRFLLAVPAGRKIKGRVRITPELIESDRLLLLEEGHCLRDQALSVCDLRAISGIDTFGASSLSTIVQMVSNGLGMTLLPEISLAHEATRGRFKVVRFADPEPSRVLGLAWRKSASRKRDFVELGKLINEALVPARGRVV